MRLFVGIALSVEVRSELDRIVARMKPKLAGWRWSQPNSWHITLQFLGNAGSAQYDPLLTALRNVRSPAVPIQLGGLDFFDHAGVFFADVAVSPQLAGLQRKVVAATDRCGFIAETRPYHPHITLARLKGGVRGAALRELRAKLPERQRFSAFTANEFLLYESFLGPGGSRYEVRERFCLGPAIQNALP